MPRQKKTLLWKLFTSHLLLTLLSVFAVSMFAANTLESFYYRQTRTNLQSRAVLFSYTLPHILDEVQAPVINERCRTMGARINTRLTVVLASGLVVGDSDEDYRVMDNHASRPELQEAFAGDVGTSTRYSRTLGTDLMYVAVPVFENGRITGAVRASVPLTFLEGVLKSIYYNIALIGLLITVATVLFSYILSKRISRPIKDMIVCAGQFADGNLDRRMPVSETDEIGALAGAMNSMAVQLEERITTITERRNELEALLSGMAEAVFSVDTDGCITEYNQAAERLFHLEGDNADGRHIKDVVKNEALQQFVTRSITADSLLEEEISLHGQDERVLQAHGSQLASASGGTSGAVIVLNDITRTKQLENIRSDFVANVSHELKTPITSIIGFVETLRDGAIEDTKNRKQFLKIILKHAERLNGIIEDLLSLSRIEQNVDHERDSMSRITMFDILSAAVTLCESKAKDKKSTISLECPDISLICNASLIEQAVVNLIDNAIKYSEKKSTIAVRASVIDRHALIQVEDNGYGIPQDQLGRIFERFYRVDKSRSRSLGGTGLGLAIVKHIVLIHHGTVGVESTPGKGSIFTISLPLI